MDYLLLHPVTLPTPTVLVKNVLFLTTRTAQFAALNHLTNNCLVIMRHFLKIFGGHLHESSRLPPIWRVALLCGSDCGSRRKGKADISTGKAFSVVLCSSFIEEVMLEQHPSVDVFCCRHRVGSNQLFLVGHWAFCNDVFRSQAPTFKPGKVDSLDFRWLEEIRFVQDKYWTKSFISSTMPTRNEQLKNVQLLFWQQNQRWQTNGSDYLPFPFEGLVIWRRTGSCTWAHSHKNFQPLYASPAQPHLQNMGNLFGTSCGPSS